MNLSEQNNAEWFYNKKSNKKLSLMTKSELEACKDHCKNMLYSNGHKKLGRYVALNNVYESIDRLHVEIFLRKFMNKYNLSRKDLATLTAQSPEVQYEVELFDEILHDNLVDLGLTLNLGKIVRTTYYFILRQGVKLTETQFKDFQSKGDVKEEICKYLGLDVELAEKVRMSKLAPSLDSVKHMLSAKDKYMSTLTQDELNSLLNEYIPRYIQELKSQAEFWVNKIEEIDLELNNHENICNEPTGII